MTQFRPKDKWFAFNLKANHLKFKPDLGFLEIELNHWSNIDGPHFTFLGEYIDQFSWTTFIAPFHWVLWLCILLLSVGSATVMWIFHKYPKGSTELDFLESIAISFSSIFGVSIHDSDLDTNSSARISLFVVYICGSLFFYVYVGFLTSSLAVPADYKPFESPEEILQTEYR